MLSTSLNSSGLYHFRAEQGLSGFQERCLCWAFFLTLLHEMHPHPTATLPPSLISRKLTVTRGGRPETTQSPSATLDFTPTPLLIVQSCHFQLAKGEEEREGRECVCVYERDGREGDVLSWFAGREVGLNAICLCFRGIQVSCFLLEGKRETEIGADCVLHPWSQFHFFPCYEYNPSARVCVDKCEWYSPDTSHTHVILYEAIRRCASMLANVHL